MTNKNILYWPGFSRAEDELSYFQTEFRNKDFEITKFPQNYDYGVINPTEWINLINWNFDWWIGMSLGASVMIYSLKYLPKYFFPKRITIINPFYSRSELAKENGFNMENQMDFQLDFKIEGPETVELISSTDDEKIKMNHGIKVINNFEKSKKSIIFVSDNHRIGTPVAQKELAKLLISERLVNEEYKYCNIYFKQ